MIIISLWGLLMLNKIILNEYIVNAFEDSDLYAVVLDREALTIDSIIYASSRAAINPDALAGVQPKCNLTEEDLRLAKHILDEKQKAFNLKNKAISLRLNNIKVGDTCEVIKGRKFAKGVIFLVTHFSEFVDPYGRVQCTYAHALINGLDKRIDKENLKIVKQGGYYENFNPDYSILERC